VLRLRSSLQPSPAGDGQRTASLSVSLFIYSLIQSAALALSGLLAAVPHIGAQNQPTVSRIASTWRDSTPAVIMTFGGRKYFPSAVIVDVLRQRQKAFSLSKRQELADSVVARAIGPPLPGGGELEPVEAVEALVMSGSTNPDLTGSPDPDVLDRLIRIHQQAKLRQARVMALTSLNQQLNPARALPYLKAVAESKDMALLALDQLVSLARDPSHASAVRDRATATLRELWDGERVSLGELCRFAADHGWPRRKDGRRCSID